MSMSGPINHLGSIWYHSEPSVVPYSQNQFLGWDFFCCFLQQDGSNSILQEIIQLQKSTNYQVTVITLFHMKLTYTVLPVPTYFQSGKNIQQVFVS